MPPDGYPSAASAGRLVGFFPALLSSHFHHTSSLLPSCVSRAHVLTYRVSPHWGRLVFRRSSPRPLGMFAGETLSTLTLLRPPKTKVAAWRRQAYPTPTPTPTTRGPGSRNWRFGRRRIAARRKRRETAGSCSSPQASTDVAFRPERAGRGGGEGRYRFDPYVAGGHVRQELHRADATVDSRNARMLHRMYAAPADVVELHQDWAVVAAVRLRQHVTLSAGVVARCEKYVKHMSRPRVRRYIRICHEQQPPSHRLLQHILSQLAHAVARRSVVYPDPRRHPACRVPRRVSEVQVAPHYVQVTRPRLRCHCCHAVCRCLVARLFAGWAVDVQQLERLSLPGHFHLQVLGQKEALKPQNLIRGRETSIFYSCPFSHPILSHPLCSLQGDSQEKQKFTPSGIEPLTSPVR